MRVARGHQPVADDQRRQGLLLLPRLPQWWRCDCIHPPAQGPGLFPTLENLAAGDPGHRTGDDGISEEEQAKRKKLSEPRPWPSSRRSRTSTGPTCAGLKAGRIRDILKARGLDRRDQQGVRPGLRSHGFLWLAGSRCPSTTTATSWWAGLGVPPRTCLASTRTRRWRPVPQEEPGLQRGSGQGGRTPGWLPDLRGGPPGRGLPVAAWNRQCGGNAGHWSP